MAYIVLPSRWSRQPPGPVGIDWSNPLARDLFFSWLPTGPGELVAARPSTLSGSVTPISSRYGRSAVTDGTASYFYGTLTSRTVSNWTLLAVLQSSGAVSTDRRALGTNNSSTTGTIVALTTGASNSAKLRVWARAEAAVNPANSTTETTASVFDGSPHVAALVKTDSDLLSYVDGAADATVGYAGGSFLFDRYAVGALYRASAGNYFAGATYLGLGFARAVPAAEVAELSRAPWQLFRPLPRRVIYSLGAGGGSQSLTATKVTNTSTFGAPTVATSTALTATKLTNTSTFGAPTVAVGAVTLAPTKFSNTSTFGAAVVTPGAVSVTATKLTNTSTFGAPVVSAGGAVLQPTKVTNANSFGAPTVSVGAVTLAPTKVTNTSTFGAPTVTQGFLLQATKFTNTSTFGAPTITVGAVTLTCGIFVNTSTFGAHTVSGGVVEETRQGGGISYQRPPRKRKKWELPYVLERAEAMLDAVAENPVTVQDFARSWAEDFEATAKSLRALLAEFKAEQDKAEEAREIAATLAELKALMATFRKALAAEQERERRAQWARENDALVIEMFRNHRRERLARIRRALESL